jgi:uncharacterized protein
MILEGLVTTIDDAGGVHLAPMGPRVSPDWSHFVLRPFPTSNTFRHLKARREGVLHVTDDVMLIARAAVGQATVPEMIAATVVKGRILKEACRYFEFVVREIDESQERMHLQAEVVHRGTLRDFFGLNRAKHAVVEAAILATRRHLIPHDEIVSQYRALKVLVEKTGGPAEEAAFDFLWRFIGGESP